jgi:maltose alpha-D-glucosyltransferase/alpha-amylase
VGDIHWSELNEMVYEVFSDPNSDFSKLNEKMEVSQLIKDYCSETLQMSSEIAKSIKNLHEALILSEDSNYISEVVESDFYLSNYTQKLNLMISDLQYLMKQESENMFYNLPKISSVLIDTKDVLEKFRTDFQKQNIDVQPVHQDLHMEQILYEKEDGSYNFYFMDFEGDPQLSLEEKKQKYPTEKDLASYLRSLSYIKFNTLLQYIEKKIVDKEKYVVSEEILYSLFFRKGTREKRKTLDALLRFLNKWESKIMNKFLKDLNPSITLINYYTIERILHEVQYEMLFRPNKFIIPLLGLQEIIENN